MPGTTLTADELATELGRKLSWIYENWQAEVAAKRLPPPLNGGRSPLMWDRAQVYAVRDRSLSRPEQIAAAAIRAAFAAADEARVMHATNTRVTRDRAALDARFARPRPEVAR